MNPTRLAPATKLARSLQVSLTTVAADDREYCDRLQTSLVRGSHELLYWGAGPRLFRGDIVALYTPKSEYLPDAEHSCVRRLYFAAAESTPGSTWKQDVFLHRRVNLEPPLTYRELIRSVGLSRWDIVRAGTRSRPMSPRVASRFLAAAGKRCPGGLAALRAVARDAEARQRVCISYSGQDWTQAHRLKLWLDAAGLRPFFVSPVGRVLSVEEHPLARLLTHTFADATLVVFLVPATESLSHWIQLELDAAVTHAKRVLLVRADPKRPWPVSESGKTRRYTLSRARERDLVATVKRELSKLAACVPDEP